MKRRVTVVLLAFVLALSFVGCAQPEEQISDDVKPTDEIKAEEPEKPKEPEAKEIVLGETITLDFAEITIKNIEFSYDILPDDTSSFYTHYAADSGQVYVHIDTDVKNLQKQGLPVDEFVNMEVDYNDGYKYNGSPVPEDTNTGFSYANITSIDPLQTLGIRLMADCPQEVAESENPVIVYLDFKGEKFFYKMK